MKKKFDFIFALAIFIARLFYFAEAYGHGIPARGIPGAVAEACSAGSLQFKHALPMTCYADNLPAGANSGNTYDYILAGAGTTATTAFSQIIKNSNCDLKYLIVDAGRSYYDVDIMTDAVDDCSGIIDCYVRHLENMYHQGPMLAGYQSMATRGTWPYITRKQFNTNALAYGDGRPDTDYCPYGATYGVFGDPDGFYGSTHMDGKNTYIPGGCGCPGDKYPVFDKICQPGRNCLAAHNDPALCGETVCISDMDTCAKNGTNLYYRTAAIGGSNSHHFMVTYAMSPYAASQFVQLSGDARFAFANWEKFAKDNDNDWQHLAYSSVKGAVGSTWQNDTFMYNMMKHMYDMKQNRTGSIYDVNNLSGYTGQILTGDVSDNTADPTRISNSDQFWLPENRQKYETGFLMDHMLGRQVNWLTSVRTWPIDMLKWVTETKCTGDKASNVVTKPYSLITKVLFNDDGDTLSRQAIGINYLPPVAGSNSLHSYQMEFHYDVAETRTRLATSTVNVYAKRGIILGGGTFNTPQFLMLSGIGDETKLQTVGVQNIRKHLPAVGANFQDDNEHSLHYQIDGWDPIAIHGIDSRFADKTKTPFYTPDIFKALAAYNWDNLPSFNFAGQNAFSYCNNATAADYPNARACPADWTVGGAGNAIPQDKDYDRWWRCREGNECYNPTTYKYGQAGFGSTQIEPSYTGDASGGRAMQMTMFSTLAEKAARGNPTCYYIMAPAFYLKGWYDIMFNPRVFLVDVLSSDLKSRGVLSLTSTDPSLPLAIDNYHFQNADDIVHDANCVNHFRVVVDAFNKNPNMIGGINGQTGMKLKAFHPEATGCIPDSVPIYDGDYTSVDDVETRSPGMTKFLKESIWNHHPSSTARMGNINDWNSVTDSYGRVWGTQNLYIIDNSNVPYHLDFFPSNPLTTFGTMQGDAICNVLSQSCVNTDPCSSYSDAYTGAQGVNKFDQSYSVLISN